MTSRRTTVALLITLVVVLILTVAVPLLEVLTLAVPTTDRHPTVRQVETIAVVPTQEAQVATLVARRVVTLAATVVLRAAPRVTTDW